MSALHRFGLPPLSRLAPLVGVSLLLVLSSPASLRAQRADPGQAMSYLKGEALGAVKGCDYAKYLQMVEQGIGNWDQLKGFAANLVPHKEWWVPFTDYVSYLFNVGTAKSSAESADAEKKSLLLTLEQVCNAAVQADEVNRIYDIIEAGSFNIGNALGFLLDEIGFTVDLSDDDPRLSGDFAALYGDLVPETNSPEDTLYSAINQSLEGSIKASEDMSAALERLSEDLTRLRRELVLLAEPDTVDAGDDWMCPEGYPDPAKEDLRNDKKTGKPICGPAPPERSAQVMAQLEALKTQIQAVGMSADARMLELETVRLMADNHLRRVELYTDQQSLTGF